MCVLKMRQFELHRGHCILEQGVVCWVLVCVLSRQFWANYAAEICATCKYLGSLTPEQLCQKPRPTEPFSGVKYFMGDSVTQLVPFPRVAFRSSAAVSWDGLMESCMCRLCHCCRGQAGPPLGQRVSQSLWARSPLGWWSYLHSTQHSIGGTPTTPREVPRPLRWVSVYLPKEASYWPKYWHGMQVWTLFH